MVIAGVGHASKAWVLAAFAGVTLCADARAIPTESIAACSVCRAAGSYTAGTRLDAVAAPVTRNAFVAGLALPEPSEGVRNAIAHTFIHVTFSRATPSAVRAVGAQCLFEEGERHRHDGRRGLLAKNVLHDHSVILTKCWATVGVIGAVQKSRGKVLDVLALPFESIRFNESDCRLEASKSFSAYEH